MVLQFGPIIETVTHFLFLRPLPHQTNEVRVSFSERKLLRRLAFINIIFRLCKFPKGPQKRIFKKELEVESTPKGNEKVGDVGLVLLKICLTLTTAVLSIRFAILIGALCVRSYVWRFRGKKWRRLQEKTTIYLQKCFSLIVFYPSDCNVSRQQNAIFLQLVGIFLAIVICNSRANGFQEVIRRSIISKYFSLTALNG